MDTATIVISATGGLALFLYGLRVLSGALSRAVGARMREFLERVTDKAYRGVLVGTLTAGILQSSSMANVLVIGLLNAGALTLRNGIGVMLGTEIGTSVTAQLIAFPIGDYYLPMIALGFLMSELFHNRRAGDVGRALLGFGILFLGMTLMSSGLGGLAHSETIIGLLESLGTNVALGVLIGAGVTALIQSSSATIGLVIAMGSAGILTLPAAIALVLGANIGTTITAQLASLGGALSARRLARAQLALNVLSVAVLLPLVPLYASLVELTSPVLERQIANAHAFFNLGATIIALPLVGKLAWLVEKLVRGRERTETATPQYLAESFLAAPAVALNQARQEVLRMGDMTKGMIARCRDGLLDEDQDAFADVLELEECVDALKRAIEGYLERIPSDAVSQDEGRRLHVLQHVTGDVERVGDQAVNIAERGTLVQRKRYYFSAEALSDLDSMFERTTVLYEQTLGALREEDADQAQRVLYLEAEVDHLEQQFRSNHFKRLDEGVCNPAAGVLFVEILHNLERIGDHAVNIAGDILHAL
ncbi:MAG: Na/Pi cotransporter family protein [Candidatus Bipolaricaulota bacterium]